MIGLKPSTQQWIEAQITFFESSSEWYDQKNESRLAAWSREQAAAWRAKLKPVEGRDSGDGE